jgi:TatD DNase family protein
LLIDTHCHLDDERYLETLEDVLGRAVAAGVEAFVLPAAGKKELARAVQICETHENCYFSVGSHPYHASEYDEELFESLISHPKCVAVGECGLDYYRLPEGAEEILAEKALQKKAFVAQIGLAKKHKKPLIVHIREASLDSKNILLEYGASDVGGVLHCYNADENLLSLAKNGFYFGVGGVLTFSNARKLVEILPKIPLDRLVFETDAPYLSPMPYRGKTNEPAYMLKVVEKASELLGVKYDELCDLSTQNAKRLYHIS